MKLSLRAAAAAAALAFAVPTFAQQDTQPRVGLGVSLNTSVLGPLLSAASSNLSPPPSNVYVPIYVTPNLRLEPQIGWVSTKDDQSDLSSRSFALGVGALFVKPVVQTTNLYGGARLISTWLKNEENTGAGVAKTTQRNTTIAAVLGGEWLPSPWFSLGVEAQLEYTAVGDPETKVGGNTFDGEGGSSTATQGLLFTRVYYT
jgi:hypothetical protein